MGLRNMKDDCKEVKMILGILAVRINDSPVGKCVGLVL